MPALPEKTVSTTTVYDGRIVRLDVVDVRLDGEREDDASGMELLSWMRENHPRMPVVMVSAYQTFEYEIEALERGAFRFLKKPLQPVEVKAVLKEVLGT